jgi:hypothetical protein
VNGDDQDNSGGEIGAVYVFTRSGMIWSQEAYVKASNSPNEQPDGFGWTIALGGDTLAVAAAEEDSAATGVNGNESDDSVVDSGATYVFRRAGGEWSQHAYVKASNTGADDRFGGSIALSGDTLAVGAVREDSAATGLNGSQADDNAVNSGAVYVFAP